jgi:aspartate carbamoyltransferase regulatory subunit
MSWFEVVTFFRKGDIIISGGNVVQRHILTNERVLLSFFINSIKNINIVDKLDNKLSSKLLNLFKHNNKNIIKYLKSNYD